LFAFCVNVSCARRIPDKSVKPAQGEKRGLWRYRAGGYRLVCNIRDDRVVVMVLEVGHGKGAYR